MKYKDPLIQRQKLILLPDPNRVLLRPFMPSVGIHPDLQMHTNPRVLALFARVAMLENHDVASKLDEVLEEFDIRHENITHIFMERFEQIKHLLPIDRDLDENRKLLLGSYFTNEYSFESSALFNPSIVLAPDQSGVGDGEIRFYLSLRATGEGHISSITFRSGIINADGTVSIDAPSPYVRSPRPVPAALYDLAVFRRKLREIGVDYKALLSATSNLEDSFSMHDLKMQVASLRTSGADPTVISAGEKALLLAQANYVVRFDDDTDISERILFPFSPSESNGIEDARFVHFTEEDGSVCYYATYTAYDGDVVLPQILETKDFLKFSICTLNGPAICNKGLALFPRKINGHYAMLGRQDSENIHLMTSDYLHFWHTSEVIMRPSEPWEFVQIGNCGSPIETEEGWLVLTHGVGAMRKYCIGAALLDINDPRRVIKRLRDPLVSPGPDEREGYVPNVVYSCGALEHQGNLVLPYAISDSASRFATVNISELIAAMTPVKS